MKHLYVIFIGLLFSNLTCCSSDRTDTDETPNEDSPTTQSVPAHEPTDNAVPGSTVPNAVALNVDELLPFHEGFAIVRKGQSEAMINAKGDTVIPFNKYVFGTFRGSTRDHSCRLLRSENRGVGYVNGLCLVGVKTSDQRGYEQTLWGCIDRDQKLVIPAEYQNNFQLVGDYLLTETQVGGTHVCLNRQGQLVKYPGCLFGQEIMRPRFPDGITMDHSSISPAEGRIVIQSYRAGKTKYGLANFDGGIVLTPTYDDLKPFSEGLAPVMQNDAYGQPKWGYIDASGRVVISFRFSNEPGSFHCGLAMVVPKDRTQFNYAFINTKGEIAIQEKDASSNVGNEQYTFINGYAATDNGFVIDTKGSKYGFMTPKGSYVDPQSGKTVAHLPYENYIRMRQETYEGFNPQQFVFSYNSRLGITNLNADLLIPPVFTTLTPFDPKSGLAYAIYNRPDRQEQREGYINQNGVFVLVKGKGGTW